MSVTISRLDRFESLIESTRSRGDSLGGAVKYLESISKEQEIQLFYFGGFLRDLWLGFPPRDIDIVFNKISERRFTDVVQKRIIRKNRFGGLKLNFKGTDIDAWPIEDTNSFSLEQVLPKSVNHLPSTVFFNVESIVLEVYTPVGSRWGFEKGFFKACEEKTLDLINPNNPFVDLQLARTYQLQRKLNWKIDENLRTYLEKNLPNSDGEKLSRVYQEHYGIKIDPKEIYLSIRKLING